MQCHSRILTAFLVLRSLSPLLLLYNKPLTFSPPWILMSP